MWAEYYFYVCVDSRFIYTYVCHLFNKKINQRFCLDLQILSHDHIILKILTRFVCCRRPPSYQMTSSLRTLSILWHTGKIIHVQASVKVNHEHEWVGVNYWLCAVMCVTTSVLSCILKFFQLQHATKTWRSTHFRRLICKLTWVSRILFLINSTCSLSTHMNVLDACGFFVSLQIHPFIQRHNDGNIAVIASWVQNRLEELSQIQ